MTLEQLWSYAHFPLTVAFLVSALVAGLIVASRNWHHRLTGDGEHFLPQRIHVGSVPRIGGLAIGLGVVAGGMVALKGLENGLIIIGPRALGLLMGAVPALLIGLAEDVLKRIRPRNRLLLAAMAALIAINFGGLTLLHTDVPAVDALFTVYGVALGFTVLALVGAANAFNIIDGLNGLLGGVTIISMAGIALVGQHVGDVKVTVLAGIIAAATAGFMLFNWPRARLFAGDGGAYFLGFSTAALLLLLASRNPTVSPWYGLTGAALPLVETLHTIWRRRQMRLATTDPDIGHLHQLLREWALRKRLLRALRFYRSARRQPGLQQPPVNTFRPPNGSVAPMLWIMHAAVVVLGAYSCTNTPSQILLLLGFIVCYLVVYRRLEQRSRHRSMIQYDPLSGAILASAAAKPVPATSSTLATKGSWDPPPRAKSADIAAP